MDPFPLFLKHQNQRSKPWLRKVPKKRVFFAVSKLKTKWKHESLLPTVAIPPTDKKKSCRKKTQTNGGGKLILLLFPAVEPLLVRGLQQPANEEGEEKETFFFLLFNVEKNFSFYKASSPMQDYWAPVYLFGNTQSVGTFSCSNFPGQLFLPFRFDFDCHKHGYNYQKRFSVFSLASIAGTYL